VGQRRHYFRVADQIAHEPWSDHTLAMLVRLMAHMHERWARDGLTPEEACHCVLSKGNLARISGRHRGDIAEKSLRSLGDITSMSIQSRGEVLEIHWPKFAEFQGLIGQTGTNSVPNGVPPVPDPDPDPVKTHRGTSPNGSGAGVVAVATESEEDARMTPNELADGFNEHCATCWGLPQVTVPLTADRAKRARSRIAEHPDPEWWSRVFTLIGASTFLRGNGKQAWKVDFDWLVANPTNALKVVEGKYGIQPAAQPSQPVRRIV